MPTNTVPMGSPFAMVQNTIYALPPVQCSIYSDATSPTIQQSQTVEFTANTSVTLTAGAGVVNGGFIRCTSGAINITLKRA